MRPDVPDCRPGGYFQYELEPVVGGTRLVFTHHLPGLGGGLARDPDGVAGGWHEIFDRLTEHLDGAPIGAGLAITDLARTAESWAAAKVRSGEFDSETARRHVLDLRREEAAAALNRRYRERAASSEGGQGDPAWGASSTATPWSSCASTRIRSSGSGGRTDPKELARWFIPTTTWDFQEGGAYRFHDDGFMGGTQIARFFIRFGARSAGPGTRIVLPVRTLARRGRHAPALRPIRGAGRGLGGSAEELPNDVPWAGGNLGGWHEFWEALAAQAGAPTTASPRILACRRRE